MEPSWGRFLAESSARSRKRKGHPGLPAFNLQLHLAEVSALMKKYRNQMMNQANACPVRVSELPPECQVVTTDADFNAYRQFGRPAVPTIQPPQGKITGRQSHEQAQPRDGFASSSFCQSKLGLPAVRKTGPAGAMRAESWAGKMISRLFSMMVFPLQDSAVQPQARSRIRIAPGRPME
jgi:hypothetical protein